MPLATVRMSGTTSQLSTANHLPVRPKPAITSSAMSRIPWGLDLSRMDWGAAQGGTGGALGDPPRDCVCALVLEDLLQVRRARVDGARVGMAGRAAIRVRVEHAHD